MKRSNAHSGFMLLEVVLAVGLLVLGLSVIGAQMQRSYFRAHDTDTVARVVFLAESKLAEIDTGLIEPEREIEEDFGRLFPQYAWRLTMEAAGLPELYFFELEILHDPLREVEDDFEFNDAEVAARFRFLKAAPRPLDLTADFGLDEDAAEDLNERLADLGGGALDVHDFNPALFRDMDMEDLLEILPALMEAFNISQSEIMNMVPENLRPQLEELFAGAQDDASGDQGDEGGGASGDDSSGDQGGDAAGDTTGGGRGSDAGDASEGDGADEGMDDGTDARDAGGRRGGGGRTPARRRPARSGGGGG